MTDITAEAEESTFVPPIVVHLGNEAPRDGLGPEVTTVVIPQGPAANGGVLYAFPEEHSDELFAAHPATAHIASSLSGVPDAQRASVRRALINGQFAHPSSVRGLPDHEAAVALIHPGGAWAKASPDRYAPSWVHCPGHSSFERFVAEYWDAPVGMPADVEDRYWTRHGGGLFAPGALPDPLGGFQMGHTTYGVLNQAMLQGGYTPYTSTFGTVGTATATTGTTLAGGTETGPSHVANDCAGQWLVVSTNASGAGSRVYGLILANTSGTTPTYTVDRWSNAASPGGAAGTTPNATAFYQVLGGGPPAMFMALSSDTTAFSFGGAAGTADAPLITTLLTGEVASQPAGLLRKAGVVTVSGHTWINTSVFTIGGGDSGLPFTVAKAAATPSVVVNGGVLDYMTLVSPTAVMSAGGDQLTLTQVFTETNT